MADQFTAEDDALLAQLGVDAETRKAARRSLNRSIISGFLPAGKFPPRPPRMTWMTKPCWQGLEWLPMLRI